LDLSTIKPCVAGPKRPQDRILLTDIQPTFRHLLKAPIKTGGYEKKQQGKIVYFHEKGTHVVEASNITGGIEQLSGKMGRNEEEMVANRPFTHAEGSPGYTEGLSFQGKLSDGSVVIAAITSCTNTSNPSVMIGAGLLA